MKMGSTEGRCRRGRVYERGIVMEFEVSMVRLSKEKEYL